MATPYAKWTTILNICSAVGAIGTVFGEMGALQPSRLCVMVSMTLSIMALCTLKTNWTGDVDISWVYLWSVNYVPWSHAASRHIHIVESLAVSAKATRMTATFSIPAVSRQMLLGLSMHLEHITIRLVEFWRWNLDSDLDPLQVKEFMEIHSLNYNGDTFCLLRSSDKTKLNSTSLSVEQFGNEKTWDPYAFAYEWWKQQQHFWRQQWEFILSCSTK